jgi:hypothetical protein
LMICSSVNLLLRMSISRRNGLYPKSRAFKGSRSFELLKMLGPTYLSLVVLIRKLHKACKFVQPSAENVRAGGRWRERN